MSARMRMAMAIPEADIRRLHHLAYCELGACDMDVARETAERYAAGDFEILADHRARAPQTCRQLESIRTRTRTRTRIREEAA